MNKIEKYSWIGLIISGIVGYFIAISFNGYFNSNITAILNFVILGAIVGAYVGAIIFAIFVEIFGGEKAGGAIGGAIVGAIVGAIIFKIGDNIVNFAIVGAIVGEILGAIVDASGSANESDIVDVIGGGAILGGIVGAIGGAIFFAIPGTVCCGIIGAIFFAIVGAIFGAIVSAIGNVEVLSVTPYFLIPVIAIVGYVTSSLIGNYAIEKEKKHQEILNRQKKAKESIEQIKTARSKLRNAKYSGVKVSNAEELLKKAEYAFESEKYEEAAGLAKQSLQSAEETVKLYKPAKESLELAKYSGIKVSKAEELLKKAESAFEEGKYKDANVLAKQSLSSAEESVKLYNSAKECLELARSSLEDKPASKAKKLYEDAQNAFDSGEYAKAIEHSKDAIKEIELLEKEPTTEYLLDKANHFVNKGLEEFNSKDYNSAIGEWNKAIPEYQRAIDLAERRGESDFVESINSSIETIENNILKAEIKKDHTEVIYLINKSNLEIEKGKSEYENGDYEGAKTHFEKSIDLLKSAKPISEKRDFKEFIKSIEESIYSIYESCCACILENAKSNLNRNKFAEAEKYLINNSDYIQKLGSNEQKFELNQLIESSRKGIAWSKIESAKSELEETSKWYESKEYLKAKDACMQIKESLKEVSEFVIKYDLLEEKRELDELYTTIEENIQNCLIGHANSLLDSADDLFKQKKYLEARDGYQKAREFVAEGEIRNQQELYKIIDESIQDCLVSCVQSIMDKANDLFKEKEYLKAREFYKEAEEFVKKEPIANPENLLNAISENIQNSLLSHANSLLDSADELFNKKEYLNARDSYENTKNFLIQKKVENSQDLLKTIDANIQNCLIGHANTLLDSADELFNKKKYLEARKEYQYTKEFVIKEQIKNPNELLDTISENTQKCLLSHADSIVEEADLLFEKGEYLKAKDTYRKAQDFLNKENVKGSKDLQEYIRKCNTALTNVEEVDLELKKSLEIQRVQVEPKERTFIHTIPERKPFSYTPIGDGVESTTTGIEITRETEFYNGFIRMKIAVANHLSLTVNNVELDLDFEVQILRLDRCEQFPVKNGKIQLGNLDPNTSKTVAIYFDPMICAKSGTNINCRVDFKDATGKPESKRMKTKKVKVVCPIFKTESDINIGLLKQLVEKLEWKDSKIYQIPSELKADKIRQICKETIQRHDVRHIRTLHSKEERIYEIWYYGKTKVEKNEIVIKASINHETSSLELMAATSNPESLTGLLAELGHTLSEKLSSETLGKKPVQQIINVAIKDSIIQRSNLLSYCDINGTCSGDVIIEGSVVQRSKIISNKCPNCKNDITPDMKFCSECGYKLK